MKAREELYAVLIALPADTLLLPNAAIAEVVSPDRLEPQLGSVPAWFGGRVTYGSRRLPVVRFEVLNGAPPAGDNRRTRLAIVHGITGKLRSGQYALVCQGYPHLVTLNRAALRKEPMLPGDRNELVLTRVGIANANAAIPNLEAVEDHLAQLES